MDNAAVTQQTSCQDPSPFITSLPLLRYTTLLRQIEQIESGTLPVHPSKRDVSFRRLHKPKIVMCSVCFSLAVGSAFENVGFIWVQFVAVNNYFNSVIEIRQNRKRGRTLQPSCSMHAWWSQNRSEVLFWDIIPTDAFGGLMVLVFQSLTRVMQWAPWTLAKMSTGEKGTSSGEEHGVWWRFVQYIFVCEKMKLRVKQAKEDLKLCIQPMSARWVEHLFKRLGEAVPSPKW